MAKAPTRPGAPNVSYVHETHHHYAHDPRMSDAIQAIATLQECVAHGFNAVLGKLNRQGALEMVAFADIETKFRHLTTVGDSSMALLSELSAKLREMADNGSDAQLQALADEIDAKAAVWVDGIKANTQAVDEPAPEQPADPSLPDAPTGDAPAGDAPAA